MRTEYKKEACASVIGSMTQAMKAQKALERAAIPARVEKADSSATRRGCAYAVIYDCSWEGAVREVLRREEIPIRGGMGGV